MNNDLTVLRVLYVEDNPADAELAQRVLARVAPWIDLDIASTIAEARATLQQAELPDVLATDLHLADGSGIELVSWLRTCGLALPVVVLTASGNHQSALTALRAGADDYLTKHGDYLQRLPRILREARERRLRRKAFMGASVRVLFVDADDAEIARVRDCLARSTVRSLFMGCTPAGRRHRGQPPAPALRGQSTHGRGCARATAASGRRTSQAARRE